jgi:inhibitor of cysteine peptidase
MVVLGLLAFVSATLVAQDTPIVGGSPAPASPAASASPDEGFTDASKVIAVRVGDTFTIVLDSNPTTGYSWQLKSVPPPSLDFVSSAYRINHPVLPGTGGREIWTFKAVTAGDAAISLEYVRPFDKAMVANTTPTVFRVHIVP